MTIAEKKKFIRESGIDTHWFSDYFIRKNHLSKLPYDMAFNNWLERMKEEQLKECVEEYTEKRAKTESDILKNIYEYVNDLIYSERFDNLIKDICENSDPSILDYSMLLNYLENEECDLTVEDLEVL